MTNDPRSLQFCRRSTVSGNGFRGTFCRGVIAHVDCFPEGSEIILTLFLTPQADVSGKTGIGSNFDDQYVFQQQVLQLHYFVF